MNLGMPLFGISSSQRVDNWGVVYYTNVNPILQSQNIIIILPNNYHPSHNMGMGQNPLLPSYLGE